MHDYPKCPSGCKHKHNACSAAIGFDSWKKHYKIVHVVTDSFGFEIFNLSGAAGGGDEQYWERISGPWVDDRPFNPIDFLWKNPASWHVDSSEYFISMQVNDNKFSRTYLPRLGLGEVLKRGRYELVELGGFLSLIPV